jgi:hypothetical protein
MWCFMPPLDSASKKTIIRFGPSTLDQNHGLKPAYFLYNLPSLCFIVSLATKDGLRHSVFSETSSLKTSILS